MIRKLNLQIPNNSKAHYLRVADALRIAIRSQHIRPGEFIPSTRSLAEETGLHRQTVMAALDELVAEGWIESEYRKGFRVNTRLPDDYISPQKMSQPHMEGSSTDWLSPRPIYLAPFSPTHELKFNFQSGLPDLRLFPVQEFRSFLSDTLRKKSAYKLLDYGPPSGHPQLIDEISSYLRRLRGITDRSIIVTHGSQEAIFCLIHLLIQPGDPVAIEELAYPAAREAFRFAGARLIPIRMTEEGIDPDHLNELSKTFPFRMLYLTPLHQFPTTGTLSISNRLKIYEIADKNKILILEDDYDHEFHYRCQPLAPMASHDPHKRVLYVSTFSKVLFPSARIGFMAIPPELEPAVIRFRRITSHQNDSLIQVALANWMRVGGFERHLRKMRRIYEERRNVLVNRLDQAKQSGLDIFWNKPDGGMAVWLHTKHDSQKLAKKALKQGLFISPESDYAVDQERLSQSLRLGFSNHTADELKTGMDLLLKVISESYTR